MYCFPIEPFPSKERIDVKICSELPLWLREYELAEVVLPLLEERVRFTLKLAARNIAEGTGGPFAATIFEAATGRLFAAGVNVVVPSKLSFAHAEIMALGAGQRKLGHFSFAPHDYEMIASCEPCAMCYGALLWSGLARLVYSAPGSAAEAAGFHEGYKPADWPRGCEERGIQVVGPVLPEEGTAILTSYRACGGVLYNGRV